MYYNIDNQLPRTYIILWIEVYNLQDWFKRLFNNAYKVDITKKVVIGMETLIFNCWIAKLTGTTIALEADGKKKYDAVATILTM